MTTEPPAGAVIGDESYRGFRITEMWAVTAVDPEDDSEGICAVYGKDGVMPLVGSDRNRLKNHLEPIAEVMREQGQPATIKHFVQMPDVDVTTADPEYTESVRTGLMPKMAESAFALSLFTGSEPDVKQCMELATALLMGKPLLFMVKPGAEVPPRLLKLADKVIEWDSDDPDGQAFVGQEIAAFMREIGLAT